MTYKEDSNKEIPDYKVTIGMGTVMEVAGLIGFVGNAIGSLNPDSSIPYFVRVLGLVAGVGGYIAGRNLTRKGLEEKIIAKINESRQPENQEE